MAAWDMGIPSVDRFASLCWQPRCRRTSVHCVSNGSESGHSVLTVADVLAIELLRDADVSVAAAGHRLGNRVEWVHVFETPAVTGMLRGGEFLLTTGIALAAMAPAEVDALVAAVGPARAARGGLEPRPVSAGAVTAPRRPPDPPPLVVG